MWTQLLGILILQKCCVKYKNHAMQFSVLVKNAELNNITNISLWEKTSLKCKDSERTIVF